ncbi:MAG: GNAT family N-acetyltransferase [Armatimonadetes bacterium]|nr:GNAT family N-acetyltransferase [Armatimonadota bacterium]
MPIIRVATEADAPAIREVVSNAYDEFGFIWDPDGYHTDLFHIESHYASPSSFWVAEQDGRILGCVGLEVFERLPGDPGETTLVNGQIRVAGADCEIMRLYLRPEARGMKLGYRLTQTTIDHALNHKCENMEIWTDKVLHKAHELYQSMGAKIVGERLCPPPEESPEWGMILPLKQAQT